MVKKKTPGKRIMLLEVPVQVHSEFKAACATINTPMVREIVRHMVEFTDRVERGRPPRPRVARTNHPRTKR